MLLTESSLPEQSISILECRRLPPSFLEIIGKQALCGALFTMPVGNAPQALQNILLFQCQVV
jgi:hypothetical protein